MAKVLSLNESLTVPYGYFDHVLETKECFRQGSVTFVMVGALVGTFPVTFLLADHMPGGPLELLHATWVAVGYYVLFSKRRVIVAAQPPRVKVSRLSWRRRNNSSTPATLDVSPGSMNFFDFQEAFHIATTVKAVGADPIEINNGDPGDAVPAVRIRPIVINGTLGGKIEYMCGIHLMAMLGTIRVV